MQKSAIKFFFKLIFSLIVTMGLFLYLFDLYDVPIFHWIILFLETKGHTLEEVYFAACIIGAFGNIITLVIIYKLNYWYIKHKDEQDKRYINQKDEQDKRYLALKDELEKDEKQRISDEELIKKRALTYRKYKRMITHPHAYEKLIEDEIGRQ